MSKDLFCRLREQEVVTSEHHDHPHQVQYSQSDLILNGRVCPYCFADTEYVDSSAVYGRSHGMIYLCRPCDAWVGVHNDGTGRAKGSLANAELRKARIQAHHQFDKIWKQDIKNGMSRFKARNAAYQWLSEALNIPRCNTHIGMFDLEQCRAVIDLTKSILK